MAKHTGAGKQKPNSNGLEQTIWLAVGKLLGMLETKKVAVSSGDYE